VDLAVLQLFHVVAGQRLEQGHGVGPGDEHFAHVGDVEQADLVANRQMLFNRRLVHDRHLVARKRDELGPSGPVYLGKRSFFQYFRVQRTLLP